MNDQDVVDMLERTGKAVQPDPARLKAALTPSVTQVPSPLSVRFVLRSATVALILVLALVGSLGSTTPGTVPVDEYQNFSAALAEDVSGEAEALTQLDAAVAQAFTPEDVFTDEFLEATL
jgi:hypothetical protein